MRVLVVTSMYPTKERPAYGTFVRDQVESLRDAGIDVDVLAFTGGDGAKSYLAAGWTLRQTQYPYSPIVVLVL